MQVRSVHWRSPVAATLILVLLIAIVSAFVTTNINDREESASFQRLANEAQEFASTLELNMASDRRQLELIATLAGDYMVLGFSELQTFLEQYPGNGNFFSRIEILLPGDIVLAPNGEKTDASGFLSFEQESSLGAHISDRELDLDGESYVVRHFVPVSHDGEIIAMLYGVIDISTLGQELPYTPYSGNAAVYVIDGTTGDFLIDTWHAEPGNIWATGSRPMADGYNDAQLRQGLIDGESNYVVFVSNTTGSYLYFYYMPIPINQWRVALSVPESVVFSDAQHIRFLLNSLLILESAAFLLYILWLIRYVRRETGEKQRQLDALNYIYKVEKLLFNAHEHSENVPRALEIIAKMLPAKRVAFTMLNNMEPVASYIWGDAAESESGSALLTNTEQLARYFSAGHTEICAHSDADIQAILPGAPKSMGGLAAVPVEDADGVIRGVLLAGGLDNRTDCAAMLQSVVFSFAMLCNNARTYRTMQQMGERDALTGLYNRNRYEMDLHSLPEECGGSLCCMFVDVNGLHELNNSRGHEAGDRMLRTVAGEIRGSFDPRYAYRVGGDEFIIFVCGEPESETQRRLQAMTDTLKAKGYFVSAGCAWAHAPIRDLEALIKTAEKKMYSEKQEYYRTPSNDRRAR